MSKDRDYDAEVAASPLMNPSFNALRNTPIKTRGMKNMIMPNEAWAEMIYDIIAEQMKPGDVKFFQPVVSEGDNLAWCRRLRSKLQVIRRQRYHMNTGTMTDMKEEYIREFLDPLHDVMTKIVMDDNGEYFLRVEKATKEGFRETERPNVVIPVSKDGSRKERRVLNPYVVQLSDKMNNLEVGEDFEFLEPKDYREEFISIKNSLIYAVKYGRVDVDLSQFYITIRLNQSDRKYHMRIQRISSSNGESK